MPTGVIVDDRERSLYSALNERHPSLAVSVARLCAGDIHITDSNGFPTAVIERKTRPDLRASLLDGRFHAQRERMVEEYGVERTLFLIEGGTCWAEPESGAEIGLVLRDSIRTLWTSSLEDSADLVARLAKSNISPRDRPPDASNRVRVSKASSGTATGSLASMLRCVDGVSARRATQISDEFGSMTKLANAAGRDKNETVDRIGKCKDPSGRLLGTVLAERILTCVGVVDGTRTAEPQSGPCDSCKTSDK